MFRSFRVVVTMIALTATVVTACGRWQPAMEAPGAMPQSRTSAGATHDERANSNLARYNLLNCAAAERQRVYGQPQPTISASTAMPRTAAHNHYNILHSFVGKPSDGDEPEASLINVNGTLYGTTFGGGEYDYGTVFSISKGGVEKVLYSFGGRYYKGGDGANPAANLIDLQGTLYGTTEYGGSSGGGTVFSITKNGTETVLHSFQGRGYDGACPGAGLTSVDGTLYGTTALGGSEDAGTVFSISTTGTEKVLHNFGGTSHGIRDGSVPVAALVYAEGLLYGTTAFGGTRGPSGDGTVFSISTGGDETVLHSFGGTDGAEPASNLIDVSGTLYGTAGGGPYDFGTVFSITTAGYEHVLYSFHDGSDGGTPAAGLVYANGLLYGTTALGGHHKCEYNIFCGTVFSVSLAGTETVLHRFGHGSDGSNPRAGLLRVNGTLYGTTASGGENDRTSGGDGTVFALKP